MCVVQLCQKLVISANKKRGKSHLGMGIECKSAKSGGFGGRLRPAFVISPPPAMMLQPPTLVFSVSITISSPLRCRRAKFSNRFKMELGFRIMDLLNFDPPIHFWINLRNGGPSLPIAWPIFVSLNPSFSLIILMLPHKAMTGRVHL